MPVGSHRRTDLYGLGIKDDLEDIDDTASFKFGTKATISGSSLVFQTRLSFVSVNRKPVLPGHLLVIPKRDSAQRMADLDAEEMCDLFIAVQFAQRVVERHFGAGSSTVTVQDGREAGQTVEHVHVHILPRKEGDFQKNDDVYQALDKHDKVEGGWRTNEAMAEEAKGIRKSVEELRREKNKNS
jgi:diadenosine tetraphosphate (Ap4A) HIT family hydrolase